MKNDKMTLPEIFEKTYNTVIKTATKKEKLNETDKVGGIKFPFPRFLKNLYNTANLEEKFRLLKKRSSKHKNELMRAFFGETEEETKSAVEPMLEALGVKIDGENPNANYEYGDFPEESSGLYKSVKITAKDANIASNDFGEFLLPAGKNMYIVNTGQIVSKPEMKIRAKINQVSQLFKSVLQKDDDNYFLEKGELDEITIDGIMKNVMEAVKTENLEYEIYKELFSVDEDSAETGLIPFNEKFRDFLSKSNIGNMISEIFVPILLTKGIDTFAGTNILEKIAGGKKLPEYTGTEWPRSANNEFYDYILHFGDIDFKISAKFNEGHKKSLTSVVFKKTDEVFKNTEKDEMKTLKELIKANSEFVNKGNLSFGAWILGYSLMNISNLKNVSKDIEDLKKLWTILDRIDKLDENTEFKNEELYKTLIEKFKMEYGTSFEKSTFPFSLTYFFEKYFASKCRSELPELLDQIKNYMIDDYNKQIRLKFTENGFNIEVLDFDKNINIDLQPFGDSGQKLFSSKWKFPENLAEFNKKFAEEKELGKEIRNRILRGKGQTIGMVFVREFKKSSAQMTFDLK